MILFYAQNAVQTETGIYSPIASHRLRQIQPAIGLMEYDHEVGVMMHAGPTPTNVKALVIGKNADPKALRMAEHAKALGTRVIVDVCDDYRRTQPDHMRNMLLIANEITCSTPHLADVILEDVLRKATVITDCIEGDKQAAMANKRQPLHLVWFGHASNLGGLKAAMDSVTTPYRLTVVTNNIGEACRVANVRARFVEWSLEAQAESIEEADAVLVTVTPRSDAQIKSPNRVLAGLWAGRPVIAQSIPAYDDFAEYCYIGPVQEGIETYLHDHFAEDRISRAQQLIEKRFLREQIAKAWLEVINGDS